MKGGTLIRSEQTTVWFTTTGDNMALKVLVSDPGKKRPKVSIIDARDVNAGGKVAHINLSVKDTEHLRDCLNAALKEIEKAGGDK